MKSDDISEIAETDVTILISASKTNVLYFQGKNDES